MVDTSLYPDSTVTHGICSDCARKYFQSPSTALLRFFFRLMTPFTHLVR